MTEQVICEVSISDCFFPCEKHEVPFICIICSYIKKMKEDFPQ